MVVDAKVVLPGDLVGMAHPIDHDVKRKARSNPVVLAVLAERVTPVGVLWHACPLTDHAEVSPNVWGEHAGNDKQFAFRRVLERNSKNRQ
ncbi:MAG: hypothetical protein HY287_02280 [Planctomycetes bacterium]|nr:hypothetical protein [Planctomycetota bacterium]MBI3833137.1 hypothetical protein [Planctomycetota bacterium]